MTTADDDGDDITPPCGVPPVVIEPHAAHVREAQHVPEPPAITVTWESMGAKFDDTLVQARALWQVARHPFADPLYPVLRPNLLVMEAAFQRTLRDRPDDPVAGVYLQEVRKFLGRKTP